MYMRSQTIRFKNRLQSCRDLILEKMDTYKHDRDVASLPRQLKEMGLGHSVCSTAKFRARGLNAGQSFEPFAKELEVSSRFTPSS